MQHIWVHIRAPKNQAHKLCLWGGLFGQIELNMEDLLSAAHIEPKLWGLGLGVQALQPKSTAKWALKTAWVVCSGLRRRDFQGLCPLMFLFGGSLGIYIYIDS